MCLFYVLNKAEGGRRRGDEGISALSCEESVELWSFLKAPQLSLVLAAEKKWEQATQEGTFPSSVHYFSAFFMT